MTPRYHCSSAPMAGKAPIERMDRPSRTPPIWFSVILIAFCIGLAVVQ